MLFHGYYKNNNGTLHDIYKSFDEQKFYIQRPNCWPHGYFDQSIGNCICDVKHFSIYFHLVIKIENEMSFFHDIPIYDMNDILVDPNQQDGNILF